MAKFNLKNYQKINGDEHIDAKLQKEHGNIPNEINEEQLEDYRGTEKEVLVEKLLENARGGNKEADEIAERRLDTKKALFENKYRNPSAYNGDINKLEEKRLENEPVEYEEYEDASVTAKPFRWWEDVKSPDGLKLAQKKSATQKTAQFEELIFDKPHWEGAIEEDSEEEEAYPIEWAAVNPSETPEGTRNPGKMQIVKQKDLTGVFPGVYIVLQYDPEEYGGELERIQQDAMEQIISSRPELSGLILMDDLYVDDEDEMGTVTLKAAGEEFRPVVGGEDEEEGEEIDTSLFTELEYSEEDFTGTTMAFGRIQINTDVTDENRDEIIQNAVEYINKKHPDLNITEKSLDLGLIENEKISFLVEVNGESEEEFEIIEEPPIGNIERPEEFEITDVTAQANVKKK